MRKPLPVGCLPEWYVTLNRVVQGSIVNVRGLLLPQNDIGELKYRSAACKNNAI